MHRINLYHYQPSSNDLPPKQIAQNDAPLTSNVFNYRIIDHHYHQQIIISNESNTSCTIATTSTINESETQNQNNNNHNHNYHHY